MGTSKKVMLILETEREKNDRPSLGHICSGVLLCEKDFASWVYTVEAQNIYLFTNTCSR